MQRARSQHEFLLECLTTFDGARRGTLSSSWLTALRKWRSLYFDNLEGVSVTNRFWKTAHYWKLIAYQETRNLKKDYNESGAKCLFLNESCQARPPPRVLAQKERSNIALFPWFTQETSDTLTLLLPGFAANILLTNNAHIPARISTLFRFSLITFKNLSVYSMNCQWAKLVYQSTVAIFPPDFFSLKWDQARSGDEILPQCNYFCSSHNTAQYFVKYKVVDNFVCTNRQATYNRDHGVGGGGGGHVPPPSNIFKTIKS